jgi:ATP-dependent Clp protease adaptor protein ClpS
MSQELSPEGASESGVMLEDELKEPDMFRVMLHNDDYTTMDFVVMILEEIFHKSSEESVAIMMSVHEKGMGVCGVYPREIAEFRVGQVTSRAQAAGFPLRCTMEKE